MIPYIIMLLLCGLPLLFMELSMGQYTRRGPIGAIGKMCPIFQVCLSLLDIENMKKNYGNSIIHHEKIILLLFLSIGSWSCHSCFDLLACYIL